MSLAFAHGFRPFFMFGFGRPKVISICSNSTTAQSYLSQALSLITNLQANATTNAVLQQQYPNFVAYLKNTSNQALLTSNCTSFVSNLKVAQRADKIAVLTTELQARQIQRQFQQVARTAIGNQGPTDVDLK